MENTNEKKTIMTSTDVMKSKLLSLDQTIQLLQMRIEILEKNQTDVRKVDRLINAMQSIRNS